MEEFNLTNFNNLTRDYIPYEKRLETYIVPVLFFLIFVVGIVGNGIVCVIFIRHPSMRNVPNTYIFSLAFGDLLVIFFTVPSAALIFVFDSWPWSGLKGEIFCRAGEFAKDVSIGVSIFTLVALAFDRYMAIVNPLKKLRVRSKTIVLIIEVTWIVSIIFGLPSLIVSRVLENEGVKYCSPFGIYGKTYSKYITIIKATIYYFLPLSIIAILYTLMARKLQHSAKEVQTIAGKNKQAQSRRRHVARMVIVFILVFIICFLPHWIFQLWFQLASDAEATYNMTWHVIRIVGFCLSFSNSILNPLALYFVSSLFRQYFNNYLCCKSHPVEHNASFTRNFSKYKSQEGKITAVTIVDVEHTTDFTIN